ncbi:MAG: hypothetical protein JSR73_16770 [Proteobacteria bacterium]|nr:hypothetical protein [Pseudomonadota bacterium]
MPAHPRVLKIPKRATVGIEKELVVIDVTTTLEFSAKSQMPSQYSDGARAQDNAAIVAGLGRVLVDAVDAGLGHVQRATRSIVVTDG